MLEQHIYDPYVIYSWSSPIHHTFRGALSGPISSLMGIPIYCFLKKIQSYYLDSVLPARWCFLPTVYTCLNSVALAQHSEATLTPRVIRMFECVCVCGEWDHYSLSFKKDALRAPSTRASIILVEFESTHTEARLAIVDGLVAWFEACVRIAVDFPQ